MASDERVKKYLDEENFVDRTTDEFYEELARHLPNEDGERIKFFMTEEGQRGMSSQEFYARVCERINGMALYDYLKSRCRQGVEWKLNRIMENGIESASRVIDIGCGTGLEAALYAKLTKGDVLGVDISPEMIRESRYRAERLALGNVRFEEGDRSKLKFPDGSFDFLTCFNSLIEGENYHDEWIVNYCIKERINEFSRVLGPNGKIALALHLNVSDDMLESVSQHERMKMEIWLGRSGFFDVKCSSLDWKNREDYDFHLMFFSGIKK